MNTVSKLLVLGAAVAGAFACSAEAEMPDPKPGTTGTAGSGTAGSGSPSTSGSGNVGTSGSGNPGTGGAPGTAGAGPSTGGSAPGAAGSTPGAAGSTPGAAGGGSLTTCPSPPAAGTATDLLIDDLEDKDNGVAKVGGRSGFWYTYLDTYGSTIIPMPDATGAAPLLPGSTNCNGGSTACIMISGTTAVADEALMKYPYAGVGFDFSNAKKPCVYNASAYSGIKFFARGDVEITVKVNISATSDATGGGTCTLGCSNGHGTKVILTPTWAEVDLPFATIMQDPTWGTIVPFDKATLLSLQIQVPAGGAFSVALDDFKFY